MNDELELYEEFEKTDLTELYSPNIRKQLNNYSYIWKHKPNNQQTYTQL